MTNYRFLSTLILIIMMVTTATIVNASGFTLGFVHITAEVKEEVFFEPGTVTMNLGLGETRDVTIFVTSEADVPISIMLDANISPSGGRVDFDFPEGADFVVVGGETLAIPLLITAGKDATPDTYEIEIEVERGDY